MWLDYDSKAPQVSPKYVKTRFGFTGISEAPKGYRQVVEDTPFIVHVLGWGQQPSILWSDLTKTEKESLINNYKIHGAAA